VDQDRNSEDRSLSRTGASLVSRNLVIWGHRTTVRLEDEMWVSLKDIAESEGCSVHELASRVHSQKKRSENLSSAIRVFLMLHYRDAARRAD
jgi:predicted DNA-binding ribbon-helix-helix protein